MRQRLIKKCHMCITEAFVAARGVWFLVFAQFKSPFSLQYKLESTKSAKQLKKVSYDDFTFSLNFQSVCCTNWYKVCIRCFHEILNFNAVAHHCILAPKFSLVSLLFWRQKVNKNRLQQVNMVISRYFHFKLWSQ